VILKLPHSLPPAFKPFHTTPPQPKQNKTQPTAHKKNKTNKQSLARCASAVTGAGGPLPRVKPLLRTYEKEVVLYAYHKRLDYFSTECVYAPFAARGFARDLVKDLEVR
jgi:tRNA(Ile)-lysidine synthase TilS/MesJ